MSMSKGLRVYHKLEPPYSLLIEARNNVETLILESGVIAVLYPKQTEYIRRSYTKLIDAYGCLGVFILPYAKNNPLSYLVLVTSCVSVGRIDTTDIYRITSVSFTPLQSSTPDDSRIGELTKFLSSGSFYFSLTPPGSASFYDLSICAQSCREDTDDVVERFFWNRTLHQPFREFRVDTNKWLLKVMCGGVEIRTIYAAQRQVKACVISRLSCQRVGTRFNVRGVNDEGHVANFVETEQIIFLDDLICSHIQVRGSVPLFWEQPGFQVGSHKVKMSRGFEVSTPAFVRHLRLMEKRYGDHVIVNLLGHKESEQMLSSMYKKQHALSKHFSQRVPFISFDYHSECRGGNLKNLCKLKDTLSKYIDSFGVFYTNPATSEERLQRGSFRVNCLDCLDRTNSVQTMVGLEILQKQLKLMGLADKPQMKSRFEEVYKSMWSMNGDHISRIYAGTGALGGGRSRAQDAARSANRTLQNNFLDSTKQEAIDLLVKGSCMEGVELNDRILTLFPSLKCQLPTPVIQKTLDCLAEYTEVRKVRVAVGTWNVNGGKHFRSIAFKHEEVTDWLLDLPANNPDLLLSCVDYCKPSDIFAIGFQEIVDLNAGNIVSASTQNQKEWALYLQKNLSRQHRYVILTSVQLVGVCLFVFVRPKLAKHIKNLGVTSVKTGLGGTTGNKGGVAIRFQLFNSSMCFVCSHYAAGQSNVKERNNDFHDISNRITFPMNRKVWNHDHIFYCGDFNYRIDMKKDEVKELVNLRDWSKLQSADQLTVQRLAGNVFQGFKEGSIGFAPTYKYDLFCDDYDTSEKCRVPAWTDRVLWTSRMFKESPENACRLLFYHRSELKTSDHRPVLAIFEANVLKTNSSKKQQVLCHCVHEYGPSDRCVVVEVLGALCNGPGDDTQIDDSSLNKILQVIGSINDLVLVRFISNRRMLLTFRNSCKALETSLSEHQHDKLRLKVWDSSYVEAGATRDLDATELLRDGSLDTDDEDDDHEDGLNDGDYDDDEVAVSESQKEANLLLSFEGEDPEVTSFTSDAAALSASSIDLSYGHSKNEASSSSLSNHLSTAPVPRNAITPTLSPHRDVKSLPTSSSMGTMKDVLTADNNGATLDDDDENSPKNDSNNDDSKPWKAPNHIPSRPPPPKLNNKARASRIHIIKPFFPEKPQSETAADFESLREEEMLSELMVEVSLGHSPKPSMPPRPAPLHSGQGRNKQSTWYTAETVKPEAPQQAPFPAAIESFHSLPLKAPSVESKPISPEPLLLFDHSDIPVSSLHSSFDPFSLQTTSASLVSPFSNSEQSSHYDLLKDFGFQSQALKNSTGVATFRQPPQPPTTSTAPLIPCRPAPVFDKQNPQTGSSTLKYSNCPPVIPARSNTLPPQQTSLLNQQPPSSIHQQPPSSIHQQPPSSIHQQPPSSIHQQPPSSIHQQPPIPSRQPPLPPIPQRQLPQPLIPSRPPNIPPRRN